jgi:hypothetical protein
VYFGGTFTKPKNPQPILGILENEKFAGFEKQTVHICKHFVCQNVPSCFFFS